MLNYERMIERQRKWMFFFLLIVIVCVVVTPYKRFMLGLLLGSSISAYNLFLLQLKVTEFGELVKRKKKVKSLGTISRFAAAILGVIIALRYEDYFHIHAFIIGLMIAYVVIIIDFIVFKYESTP